MTRLAATLRTDVRVQLRNGFHFAAALVVACSVVLLRWLPPNAAALLLPVVLLENVVVNTFRPTAHRPLRLSCADGSPGEPPRQEAD